MEKKISEGVGELLFTFAHLSFMYQQHVDEDFEVAATVACIPFISSYHQG
jgi:hypothetical protein